MESELRRRILQEIRNERETAWLQMITGQYLDYYLKESESTQLSLKKLIAKYNGETIMSYLGEKSYPNEYTHISLFHSMTEKDLYPCVDNDGGIYPWDQEVGQISKDPQFWDSHESDEQIELRHKYHNIIFMCWISTNWINIEGYRSNIVVKTLENNSTSAFYLNDFQFDELSRFHLLKDWRKAVKEFNVKSISFNELYDRVKKKYDR
jgi:hypothetical protein